MTVTVDRLTIGFGRMCPVFSQSSGHTGCGIFSADTSYVALDSSGQICGVLIASRIEADTGMIPQISVRSSFQGKGLGTVLLYTYLREAKKRDFKRITLSVSEANRRAYHLYLRSGFEKTKDFHAFIWSEWAVSALLSTPFHKYGNVWGWVLRGEVASSRAVMRNAG